MNKNSEFIKVLTQEWIRRQKLNRRYSLRAFANSLSISPSRLSDFLNGKGGVSANRALELAKKLNFSDEEFETLHLMIQKEMPSAKSVKKFATRTLRKKKKKFNYARLIACRKTMDRLSWEHLYIAEIVSEQILHQSQIAKRLDIHPMSLTLLLREAQELQLIESASGPLGFWQAKESSRCYGDAKASPRIRHLHFEMLKQIPKFCESCENDERELSSSLLQLDQRQVEGLSHMIREFVKSCLAEANKVQDSSKRLYGLALQLFPIENQKENI
jgi:uncharacterized protein (TIGR02147 family)